MDVLNILSFNKKFDNILNWKIDKLVIKDDIVRKIEFYNYIYRKDVGKLVKYLNSTNFKYGEDKSKYNNIFSILLKQNEKYISKNKYLKNNFKNEGINIKIIDKSELENYNFYYYIDFIKVIKHRNTNFLIKIYRNESLKKEFSKIEITYGIKKNNYNLYYGDWINKFKGIGEIVNKINKKVIFYGFKEDYSGKLSIKREFIKIISKYTKNKIEKITKLLS